ncbi:hypothetical protein C1Y63_10540 [Corynebacterium sp. 13CS0277]|uniref:hypothetical protein n=1 Tax=Corynebacterium sp. 13CS0277 TaxID=2071994 RepID=UPI000D02E418|nr:hypothetical protein [Corynebacterium sp. 13CS0277]PRQ10623.1 hypothetical protein C1Y63_10540 [Corynebacterium sp. 13CS0277]
MIQLDKLIGSQQPRLSHIPDGDTTWGDKAVKFCRDVVGMTLLPWQENLLRDMCRMGPDEKWAARESVVVVPRQNGKGEVILARTLAGVYLFGEKTIFHTAHLMDTAIDACHRTWEFIEASDDLLWAFTDGDASLQPRLRQGNGKECIEFPALGAKIWYRTRTPKTARGLSVDLLIYDECFNLPRETFAAMDKTTRAKQRAQKMFISSPVNRFEHAHGAVFSAKRWAAMDGAPGTLFAEWSAAPDADPLDPATWAQANPSLGPVAQLEDIRGDAHSASTSADLMGTFMVETLGVGDWYPRDGEAQEDFTPILPYKAWEDAHDPQPRWQGTDIVAAFDTDPDGKDAAVVVAYPTAKGVHLALQPGTEFDRESIVAGVVKLVDEYDPLAVVVESRGPAATTIQMMQREGLEPAQVSARDVTRACELFLSLFHEGRITHDGNPRWADALARARFRSMSSGRAIERYTKDACVFVAATFAAWGLEQFRIPDHVDVRRLAAPVESTPMMVTSGASYDFDF